MDLQRLALPVLASLLMAGCTLPWADRGADAEPQLILPKPGCAKIEVAVHPATIRTGEEMTVVANLTNVCAEAFETRARNGCERDGLDLSIVQGGNVWRYRGPDATKVRTCPTERGEIRTLEQGQSLQATFHWDGTFSDDGCVASNGEGCGAHYPAPAGGYQVRVTLLDSAASASVPIQKLP